IERADSVTLDAHKWLFVPFECGGLLVRDPAVLRAAFHVSPEYLHDVSGPDVDVNFAEYGGQLTRAARALKVWCAVQHFGTRALAAEVEAGLARARHAEQVVRETPELELLAPTTLGICCFRVRPRENLDDAALDALNERVLQRLTAEARWLISSTRLRGRLALRVCPIGFRTTPDDVAGALRRCVELAGEAEG
ncbi:MAG TPA: pyridoxal-dependent decarboxylase, partial [Gemmatimonadaceae bacterium]|nr:pyridoxal-dependent decarboxylase [Gemmatimonadaceae bacterium]